MKDFLADIIRMAVISLVISAFFIGVQWLLSILSLCNPPTWLKFWCGAAGIFAVWFLFAAYHVVKHFINNK